jgi:hypothetical protein
MGGALSFLNSTAIVPGSTTQVLSPQQVVEPDESNRSTRQKNQDGIRDGEFLERRAEEQDNAYRADQSKTQGYSPHDNSTSVHTDLLL